MLLRYSVENYKGFGISQNFQLISTPKSENSESLIEISDNVKVNSYACIIGPNGSGKTHLLSSLRYCTNAVDSRKIEPITPFLLDDEKRTKPTTFELTLFDKQSNDFYIYGFSIYKTQVVSESLVAKRNEACAKPRTIFERTDKEVKFSSELKELENFIVPNLDSGGLITSFAASIKNDSIKFIHDWCGSILLLTPRMIRRTGPSLVNTLLSKIVNDHTSSDNEEWSCFAKKHFSSLINESLRKLQSFGIPIESMSIECNDTGDYFLTIKPKGNNKNIKSYTFSEAEEFFSEGTFNAICLILIVDFLNNNAHLLLLDEIDGSFHHKLTRTVIDSIRESNKETQLIIATHDALLLDYKFRRDAVFTVTKDDNFNSIINRVSDFSIRKDAKLSSKYFSNEFGALPNIIKNIDSEADFDY